MKLTPFQAVLATLLVVAILCVGSFWLGVVDFSWLSGQGVGDNSPSEEEETVWVEQSPQDGHVVVGEPTTTHMEPWLRQNFDVTQQGYSEGTRFSQMGLHDGDVVSFHLVDNHRDLPQDIFPDQACFGTVFVYDEDVHGSYRLPSPGNVVVWDDPNNDLIAAIGTWNEYRQNANPGWVCDYPSLPELLASN